MKKKKKACADIYPLFASQFSLDNFVLFCVKTPKSLNKKRKRETTWLLFRPQMSFFWVISLQVPFPVNWTSKETGFWNLGLGEINKGTLLRKVLDYFLIYLLIFLSLLGLYHFFHFLIFHQKRINLNWRGLDDLRMEFGDVYLKRILTVYSCYL